MKLIVRLFFGTVVLIVWLSAWLFGEPPAISIFWERSDVVVVKHETREVYDGWSTVQRTDPFVEVESGSHRRGPIRLLVKEAVGDRDTSIKRWPVGLTVSARISPGGDIAYPSNWWPFMLVPAVAMTIIIAFLAFITFSPFPDRRLRAQGRKAVRKSSGMLFSPIAFLFGFVFTAVPLALAFVFWTFGDPPPYSIAWPRSDMFVASSQIRPHRVGNGTMAAYLDVMVTSPDQVNNGGMPLQGITGGWITIPEAQELREARYMPGESVRTMQSPDGKFYVVRWRFADFLALLIIPLGLISLPVGLFAFRLAFN